MPRAGLTPARVVEEAAAVVDEVGWDQLTLAAVAGRCGVRLPSLYKHIDSLEALRFDLSAYALHELGRTLTAAVLGRSGADALVAMADAYRDYARAHPGRYAATVAAPTGTHRAHEEAAQAVLEVVQAPLTGYGLHGDHRVDATRALRAALHGFVDIETHAGFGLPVDVDRSYRRLVRGLDATLAGWAGDGRNPPPEETGS